MFFNGLLSEHADLRRQLLVFPPQRAAGVAERVAGFDLARFVLQAMSDQADELAGELKCAAGVFSAWCDGFNCGRRNRCEWRVGFDVPPCIPPFRGQYGLGGWIAGRRMGDASVSRRTFAGEQGKCRFRLVERNS